MILEITAVITTLAVVLGIRKLLTPADKISPIAKAVLITGCDTGFGHELAQRLHRLGFVVFAACLDSQGEGALQLTDAQSESGGGASGRLHVIQMDVTKEDQVTDAVQTVYSLLPESTGLWAVVNNAGISTFGDVEFCGLEVYQRVANVNLWGAIRVCKAFLPLLRKTQGRIVNVTSVLGRQASMGRSCYVATKHALEGFTQCLRYEMRNWGVQVVIVEPGNFIGATGIFTQDKIDKIAEEMWSHMSDEVKESYGEDLFQSRVKRMRYFTRIGDTDTRPVIDALTDAVTDETPRVRYEPKTLYWRIRTFVMTILPHRVGNYFYHTS
ncbi:D-beta-hydroxybutyrate dehydrogenase, mitochondrial-like [Patiria miniata]|uniref:D-beta-hydroxybutyrate dehydrogenase, mitochondrial n=1 Tax=Patiria miniata TaxID=46514 RepID=A0A914A6Z6_PATMI|nr:D-beta-hydroxybutyrate dehydrogenase, mitochondrial-like [Patiria miniata]XP_038059239.1 D-beta-hydroxybutyrate dehydrogenase, mitochondrial-like [Patiria miniata]